MHLEQFKKFPILERSELCDENDYRMNREFTTAMRIKMMLIRSAILYYPKKVRYAKESLVHYFMFYILISS